MFRACPTCQGWGIPIGAMVLRVEACPRCRGSKIINEYTGLPGWMDDLSELTEDYQKERGENVL